MNLLTVTKGVSSAPPVKLICSPTLRWMVIFASFSVGFIETRGAIEVLPDVAASLVIDA